jgi:hypothetical protein
MRRRRRQIIRTGSISVSEEERSSVARSESSTLSGFTSSYFSKSKEGRPVKTNQASESASASEVKDELRSMNSSEKSRRNLEPSKKLEKSSIEKDSKREKPTSLFDFQTEFLRKTELRVIEDESPRTVSHSTCGDRSCKR